MNTLDARTSPSAQPQTLTAETPAESPEQVMDEGADYFQVQGAAARERLSGK